jgi:hypothetical protein
VRFRAPLFTHPYHHAAITGKMLNGFAGTLASGATGTWVRRVYETDPGSDTGSFIRPASMRQR